VINSFERFYLCHCEQCQKVSGSDHVSNLFGKIDSLNWLAGEQSITRFEYPGRGFTNAFCKKCGSGVPYLNQSGTAVIVRAGSLDGDPTVGSASKIFYSERPPWAETTADAELFEKFPT
jgi:hypothetical protein